MLKFDASIFGGELPVGLGVVGVAVVLPGGDFLDEDLHPTGVAECFPQSCAVAFQSPVGAKHWSLPGDGLRRRGGGLRPSVDAATAACGPGALSAGTPSATRMGLRLLASIAT